MLDVSGVGAGWAWMLGGGASPCDLPDCEAVDARASLARRVGAGAALAHRGPLHSATDSWWNLPGTLKGV